ncbi:MAG: response regulator transcription factor [Rhodospirillales bacterium]
MNRPDPTVFVVDDDAAVLDALGLLFRSEGMVTETFPTAENFLDTFESDCHGCLVADIRLPGLSGLDLFGRLQGGGTALPVIFITGHADVPVAVSALKAGAFDFIEKPFDESILVGRVRDALTADLERRDQETQRAELRGRADSLSAREREVMDLVAAGHSNKAVAEILAISPRTVEIYRARVMQKMGARSLSDLVRMTIVLDRSV